MHRAALRLARRLLIAVAAGAVLAGSKYGVRQTRGKFGLGAKMVRPVPCSLSALAAAHATSSPRHAAPFDRRSFGPRSPPAFPSASAARLTAGRGPATRWLRPPPRRLPPCPTSSSTLTLTACEGCPARRAGRLRSLQGVTPLCSRPEHAQRDRPLRATQPRGLSGHRAVTGDRGRLVHVPRPHRILHEAAGRDHALRRPAPRLRRLRAPQGAVHPPSPEALHNGPARAGHSAPCCRHCSSHRRRAHWPTPSPSHGRCCRTRTRSTCSLCAN